MEVENNEEYDSLYNQGFDERITDVATTEPEEEEVVEEEVIEEVTEEQPESDTEEEEVTEPDEEVAEEETVDTEDSEEPKLFEVKHNGQVMKLTEDEMLMMANKGFDYTSKTQDLATKRKTLDIVDGLDDNLLQTVSDAKSGNKEAVAKLVRDFGIDPYDIDTEQTTYKPVVEEKNYALDDVIEKINRDVPNAETLNGWVNNMPSKSKDFLVNNPNILDELYVHTANGVAQKVMPEVMKQIALNPELDFMGTYNQIHSVLIKPEVATEEVTVKPVATKDAKKKASVSKSKSNSRINDHKDIWEDDDLYKKMQEMRRR